MRILVITIGSAGDVHPFVGLALELQRRGHDVTLATNGHFAPLVTAVGLTFEELGSADHYRESIAHPDLWHARRGLGAVLERGVVPQLKPTMDLIARHSAQAPGDDPNAATSVAAFTPDPNFLVIASTLTLGARIAQEVWNIPVIMTHLSPSIFRSVIDPPVLPGIPAPRRLPAWAWRGLFAFGDRFIVDAILAPPINALRAEYKLAPVKSVLGDWLHSPQLTLGLFPVWFAPPPRDWPPQVRLTGFPQFDERDHSPLPDELAAFLKSGDKPIVFTAGTAMTQGAAFFRTSITAARQLGRRAILLTRHPEQLPAQLPPGIVHVAYAPFSALLPRAALLVHHGGIGTTAQALAAGVPQLVRPMAHDQFDNAARVRRMGVGDSLSVRRYSTARVARVIDRLLNDASVSARCIKTKMRFIGTDPIGDACDAVELFARSSIEHPDPQTPV